VTVFLLFVIMSSACAFIFLWRQKLEHFGRWDRYAAGGNFEGAKPSMSPDGSLIVFASPRTGCGDIYSIKADGSQATVLTPGPQCECDPQFSADGSRIVFVREDEGIGHIWTMKVDGSQQRQLAFGTEYDDGPCFSPDGLRIAYTRRVNDHKFKPRTIASAEIFVMRSDGTEQTRLTDNDRADWQPSWSADGRSLLFATAFEGIWKMDAAGTSAIALGPGSSPQYSPDGKRIVFVSDHYGKEISIMNADGGDRTVLFRSQNHCLCYPSFCPGGSKVLFFREEKGIGVGDICLIGIADRKVIVVGRND